MRIALLGGSFDPVHDGHLQIAKTALKKMKIDQVWFMPCKDAPLKNGQTVSFHHRCEMVKRAIAPYRKMKLCRIEGELEGVSYTIRTVLELKKRYPHDSFSFLIGDDQALQFHKWKEADRLLEEVSFYVFSRVKDAVLPKGMHRMYMDLIDVSSTDIRNGNKHWYLPKAVKRYMGQHYLYIESHVQQRMGEHRWNHSLSVAKLCKEIAHAHQLDEVVAWNMGIAHDVCKQLSKQKSEIWMKHHLPEHINEAVAIWHGYVGAKYTKNRLYVEDQRVISAIYHHVLGDGKSDYDIILYCADKLDPSRGYDSSKQIALCKKNLKLGFNRVKEEQYAYLCKEGVLS